MSNDLLKVMIVDDEEPVRGLFKMSVDWNGMGMEVAAEASSASEALYMIEYMIPDIIFTDICMPFMDGLEFSRLVVEKYPHIKIVALTAHEEFDYAKKGIKIGLSDFLPKPMDSGEITKVALRLKDRIAGERQHMDEYNSLKKRLAESYPYLFERFLNELLHNAVGPGELDERLAYFSLEKFPRYHRVAVIEAAHPEINREVGEEDKLILAMQCAETVKKYFKEDPDINVFFDTGRRIVVLNSNPDIDLIECSEQIKTLLINRLKCYVSIGVGNACDQWPDAGVSYREACDALDYRVFTGWNQVTDFNDISCDDKKTVLRSLDTGRIATYVKSGTGEKAAAFMDEIYEGIRSAKDADLDQLRTISANVISSVLNALNEIGIDYSGIFNPESLPYNVIFRIDNLPDVREYVKGVALEAADAVRSLRSKKENNTISTVKKYMQEHLAEPDLSLASVAARFYKNSSYMSRIFKQETGQNFIEHLTRIRMEKAIELLNGSDMKAYEIAEAVGIQDPNYFSICFKKFAGISVNDYKKQVKSL